MQYDEKQLKWYDRHNVPRPEHIPHATAEEIRSNLTEAKVVSWRLEGNRLIADTDMGPFVQTIPTDYICLGKDKQGLPILKKIV